MAGMKLIELPDGSPVRGRGLPEPADAPDYGLYLGGSVLQRRHHPSWPHDWITWPDFLLPRDFEQAVTMIRGLHSRAQAGESVEVACGGGVGRTGTVISCLAVLAGISPDEAVEWTRANYHPRAVETPWQRKWIGRFARRIADSRA
jgi:protein-tyrosine phosphatase